MEYVFTFTPAAAAYWTITVVWLGECVVFRSRSYGRRASGRTELLALVLAAGAALAVCGAAYHLRLGMLPDSSRALARAAGLGLYGTGILLRYWSAAVLGAWFTRDVRTSSDQELVAHGPYRLLRHPLYLGLLLAVTGMDLAMGSWLGTLIGVALLAAALRRRIAREEEALEEALGDRYREWRASRYRLIPGVY